ncbi:MAG: hypothetical protein PWP04_822 [Candidatus Atribacteria bacterium]|nr:hypothetical protein [Candidatus Atribacteria bacterium]
MGIVHKFEKSGEEWNWQGVTKKDYPSSSEPGGARGASVRWLIGREEGAPYFALRYFEVEPGGQTILDQHQHDHGVFILRGKGTVLLGEEKKEVSPGDVIYIPPGEVHQLINRGEEVFGFLCIIPNKEHLRSIGVL